MMVTYDTKHLASTCTVDREMRKAYPANMLKPLKLRIKEMESASTIRDLQEGLGKWHPLTGRGAGVYAASLSANYRLIVQFDERDGAVTANVRSIEDYH
ncbi:MAG: plasmid maintenance system killer protein [Spirosoma sp.]|nr:plasmid maintenance system killer protein [Spirosoma sp.]